MTSRRDLKVELEEKITLYERNFGFLSGIIEIDSRSTFIEQLIDSIHRIEYVDLMNTRNLTEKRTDPSNADLFNPLLGAIFLKNRGNLQEAFWLIFLFTHFGRNSLGGWRYAREFYGKLNQGGIWDWSTVSSSVSDVKDWISDNSAVLSRPGGGFGNHRKYESISQLSEVIESYVNWVKEAGTHQNLIDEALLEGKHDPKKAFHLLYKSMTSIYRFGRTAKFDYLTMLGKTQLALIVPDRTYIQNATGPKYGGYLLFGDPTLSNSQLEVCFSNLNCYLEVGFQVLEDSVCNWQKNPRRYKHFSD